MTDTTKVARRERERRRVLNELGASASERDELLAYNQNLFDWEAAPTELVLPLDAEPAIDAWSAYELEARERGAFTVLRDKLVQLRFPIRAGISDSDDYRAATRRGVAPELLTSATGLELERPDRITLAVYPTAAGPVPVIVVEHRPDFAVLVRALSHRNEPTDIPDAQGACVIGGLNNWDRVKGYRRRWQRDHPHAASEGEWSVEFRRLAARKELYQDRLILLSTTPYSAVPAEELGLTKENWEKLSLIIRREHECAHYFTKRALGHMANNALDELIADYAGIHAAAGEYRADWFLRFVGIEDLGAPPASAGPDALADPGSAQIETRHRAGARLEIYRADPPLSDRAFALLSTLLVRAAHNLALASADLDQADDARPAEQRRVLMIAALSRLTLELVADELGATRLRDELDAVRDRVRFA